MRSFLAQCLFSTCLLVVVGCAGTEGQAGENGVNCWDGTGDVNLDGVLTVEDCIAFAAAGQDGANGTNGLKGDPGQQGIPGEKGDTGAMGDKGDQGVAGQKGDKGDPGASAPEVIRSLVQGIEQLSIVIVWCEGGYGSGTVTDDGKVITAAHVVYDYQVPMPPNAAAACPSGATLYHVVGPNEEDFIELGTAPALGFSMPVPGRDVALLDNIRWEAPGAALPGQKPIFDWSPSSGDLTVIAGHPDFFFDVQITVGYVVAPSLRGSLGDGFEEFWSEGFTSSSETASGSSGGPVFDSTGRWVGILVGGSASESVELSIAIPLRH